VPWRKVRGVESFICVTCGTAYPPSASAPERCPICLDDRQYVGRHGQTWTTMAELGGAHGNRIAELEPGVHGIGTEPSFAIGQRALLVEGLLWDCVSLLDEASAATVESLGGIETIAVSHPHYYSAMNAWADRFDARILLHDADARHIRYPSARIELWSGERHAVSERLELIRLGGHFPGATVCLARSLAAGRGALLSGDVIQVVPDRGWVSFMWSYPNLIPLPATEVERIRAAVEQLEFARLYGAWWDRVIDEDAKRGVLASAERYLAALRGELIKRC
jgi:hypothetical protein